MEAKYYRIIDICESTQIETAFIQDLHHNGLIKITLIESQEMVDEYQLPQIERYANWYYDLELNIQGIEIVHDLLEKIEKLQHEVRLLKKAQHS